MLAAGVGLPYQVVADPRVSSQQRYQHIASEFGLVVADHQVNGLLREASAGLAEHGDLELFGSTVERILIDGNGATQQRRALEQGGTAGLAELLLASLVERR